VQFHAFVTVSSVKLIGVAVVLFATVVPVQEKPEKNIQWSDLPPAVQQRVNKEKEGFSIRAFEAETEKAQTVYEVKFKPSGTSDGPQTGNPLSALLSPLAVFDRKEYDPFAGGQLLLLGPQRVHGIDSGCTA
jgi:hypothetical protein